MRTVRRSDLAVAAALAVVAAVIAGTNSTLGDYSPAGAPAAGNAAPAIDALLDGHLGRFAQDQPLLGAVSLLLRLPFAALARAFGGGDVAVYQAGSFACLLGPVALGTWVSRLARRRGRHPLTGLALGALCVANPVSLEALRIGHPEEPLAAALVVAAVIVARHRPVAAGVAVGLAIATKQWALVALPVAVVAAPGRRMALAAVALGVAACLLVPVSLADSGASGAVRSDVLEIRSVSVLSAWWPVAPDRPGGAAAGGGRVMPLELTRAVVAPLILGLSVLLAALLQRRTGDGPGGERALALLALLLVLRCALDPADLQYYSCGAVLAVTCWDGLARSGIPVVALLFAASSWGVYGPLLNTDDDVLINAGFLALTALFTLYMALAAFAPDRLELAERAAA